jgi:hypothetical protein
MILVWFPSEKKNSYYLLILNIINLFNNFKENKIISIILVNKLKNIFKFK